MGRTKAVPGRRKKKHSSGAVNQMQKPTTGKGIKDCTYLHPTALFKGVERRLGSDLMHL